jgi:hypothetical protein
MIMYEWKHFMDVIFFTLTWPNVKVRRIQLKLTSHQDFDAVLTILENYGLIANPKACPPNTNDGAQTQPAQLSAP